MLERLTIASFAIVLSSPSACAQKIIFDASKEAKADSAYHPVWDPLGRRLISYRNASDPAVPAVQVSTTDGKKVSFYPVRDLGASYIDIWDATGSPDGGVVIAAILGYGSRNTRPVPVKSLILTYDSIGTLRSVWDVRPYHHHHVAADSAGNVYAVGHTDLNTEDYPLLIKYSSSGQVVGEYLSSRSFSDRDKVVLSGSSNGENHIFVKNDQVFVWIAGTQELFAFTPNGTLVSRTPLSSALTNMATMTGSARVNVFELRADSAQGVVAQVQLWPKDGSLARVAVAHISTTGSFENWVEPVSAGVPHRFLGLTQDDKPVFLEKFGQTAVAVNFIP